MIESARPPVACKAVLPDTAAPVPRDIFLSAMRQAASPVCVVTTRSGGQRMALTISSFLSVSADPPLISVCINRNSRMCAAMTDNGVFGVHILSADQSHVADCFAGRPQSGQAYDFSCVEWLPQGDGHEPAMSGGAMSAECSIVSATDAGTHRLFIAAVRNLTTNDKRPLLCWNRLYGFPAHAADN
ncbi:MAG: NADH-dependent flavin reductase [Paracidovorax wautersii]|uniref:NADH-dependent flavin reductase n=1 Tax=Paracidovorax wautersii TaxID=1177982 RepID=A0A7V8FMH3_9BURK|nr:MAG: NADH-dependent flavin reductase [Paracidovorax wautersii]